ncbi:MAG: dehydrogenase [halophilic archaeon J07HX64]|jgi:Dehydrogenases with different specificities (related to short-chain alcohol dehydrogenases)|nr:MAG: dehydrogenase [halophilic archaeon J07HX64]
MTLTPDLDGRTALVTGSATRVGRELLLRIADCGADVVVHYRESEAEATATAAEARERGVAATTVQGDITRPDEVDAMFDAAERELGGIDVLVNNVGNFDPRHWEEIEWDAWRSVVESTFYGTVLCSRRAVDGMRDRGWGRIVNIGFADSDRMHAPPVNFPYFVAKTGVLMFTRMLAGDTQDDGVTVNAVSPFAVENTVSDVSAYPRGRAASFNDVAAPLLFFLSESAAYISGENVAVDGGRLTES